MDFETSHRIMQIVWNARSPEVNERCTCLTRDEHGRITMRGIACDGCAGLPRKQQTLTYPAIGGGAI